MTKKDKIRLIFMSLDRHRSGKKTVELIHRIAEDKKEINALFWSICVFAKEVELGKKLY